MKKHNTHSLSSRIVFSITLVSILMILIVFFVLERINKDAFYNVEIEKANIIVTTIEPLIAINLYLQMNTNAEKIVDNLIINPNILSVKIFKNNKMMYQAESQKKDIENSFVVEKTVFQPNSQKKIGKIVLTYSSENYKELQNRYTNLTVSVLIVLVFLFVILGLYIKRILRPLRKMGKTLKNYTPKSNIHFPFTDEDNEIGQISNALNDMQQKIIAYSKEQENINKYLEKIVDEKTLKLQTQLYTNDLTGLPNRLSLVNDIADFDYGALLIINIDDFKEINDYFGNVIGDSALISLANKLGYTLNNDKNLELKHLHGDEFGILIKIRPSLEDFIKIIQNVLNDIENMTFHYENNELGIRVTIGAVYGLEGALEKADIALKVAKKKHLTYMIYDENLNIEKQYEDNMQWIKKLKIAITQDKIVPFFQPIYDNKSGKIVSCESLIRLIDEENNVIPPFKFLAVAQKSRVYSKLTRIMLKKSCEYFENIDCDFSVNLSITDILDDEIITYLKYKINKHNVSNKIILEILETEGIENYEEISLFINDMKSLGCKIAIDDFGSGYSNFEYLIKLNIDYVKIDGTLIKNIDTDKNSQIITQTIVDFANKLNIFTIAEYVHNEAVFKRVKRLKVTRTQGYYLCEPQREVRDLILENHKSLGVRF